MNISSLLKCLLLSSALQAVQSNAAEPQTKSALDVTAQSITHAGSQPSITGPASYFTGNVRIDPVWSANDDVNVSGGLVTFEPSARSAWHTHPKGQYFVVVSGVGLTQEWGKPVRELHPGDVVWCPPGVKHWHGAAPSNAMTHLAVTATIDGKNVEWMEKVSDEQYKAR